MGSVIVSFKDYGWSGCVALWSDSVSKVHCLLVSEQKEEVKRFSQDCILSIKVKALHRKHSHSRYHNKKIYRSSKLKFKFSNSINVYINLNCYRYSQWAGSMSVLVLNMPSIISCIVKRPHTRLLDYTNFLPSSKQGVEKTSVFIELVLLILICSSTFEGFHYLI